jgi:hypothetical protein
MSYATFACERRRSRPPLRQIDGRKRRGRCEVLSFGNLDIGGDAPCLVATKQIGGSALARLVLIVDEAQRLPVVVANDEACAVVVHGPRRRVVASGHHSAYANESPASAGRGLDGNVRGVSGVKVPAFLFSTIPVANTQEQNENRSADHANRFGGHLLLIQSRSLCRGDVQVVLVDVLVFFLASAQYSCEINRIAS